MEKHEKIKCNSMDRINFPRVQRIAPDVAELILRYRASVEAKNPDLTILAQIQEIQTAINTLLSIKHSDNEFKGGR